MSLYNKVIDLQKLNAAWEHVHKNKPSSGVDNVSHEQFHQNRKEELKQLQLELQEHSYETLPVRSTMLYKGEKMRMIALYSMRDKVVQQSLAVELNRIYDNSFSNQTYAYRNNRSALSAVYEIEKRIQTEKYAWILKADISKFFDMIQWEQLKAILKRTIFEEDVLDLIRQNVQTNILDDAGELHAKSVGIHQGSIISPILSNVYLLDFDLWLETQPIFFIRYSDDMIMLAHKQEELSSLLKQISSQLGKYGLKLNEEKTSLVSLDEGVNFLGYHFDKSGKSIPGKAEKSLEERLETLWLTPSERSFQDKLKKVIEIIGGWEQYFGEKREMKSIFEYVALVSVTDCQSGYWKELKEKRVSVCNIYKDIAQYLAEIWRSHGENELELLEYEQFYQIWNSQQNDYGEKIKELLSYYRKIMIMEDADAMVELMQIYSDCHEYEKASFWMNKKEESQKIYLNKDSDIFTVNHTKGESDIRYDKVTAGKLMYCFVGREDMFSIETLGYDSKRQMESQLIPLTEDKVYEHLQGKTTIGTYIQRPNSTVRYIVVDVDVSKKILLKNDRGSEVYNLYFEKARNLAKEILKIYRSFGMQGYLEYSGCRGFHVWLLFAEWIQVRYVNMFCDVLDKKLNLDEEGIGLEYFPNKTRVKPGKYGQTMKLPCGYHARTGERSYFIEEDGSKVIEMNSYFDNMAKFSLQAIKRVLAANSELKENENKKMLDMNLEPFSESSENILEILKKCSLMRYLCQKASKTGYLTHFERLSVLYVFGHLGDEGQQFVHQVMSLTLNYQYNTTEKFIRKVPEKPVSCIKLRDQYKQITAEYGCNCNFKRSKNCYPSPVLHVIALSNNVENDITIPTSRTMSKEKEKKVLNELNIHKKAQELAEKILGLKKQKRSLDATIGKLERELGNLYDSVDIDCLEIEMGMLVRRKMETGIEWVIEL